MTDSNDLLESEISSGDTGIDSVGQPIIALSHGFDDRRGVNACSSFKGILAKDGIVPWKRDLNVFVGLLHVSVKHRQIVFNNAHEFEIDQRQTHGVKKLLAFIDEGKEFLDTVGCDVPARVANAKAAHAEFHGSVINHLHIFGV